MAVEQLTFKVDCEWLCNFVRQRVWHEGLPFLDGLKVLKTSFSSISEEVCHDILTGKKKIVGINSGELVEDDKFSEYLKYLKKNEEEEERLRVQEEMRLNPINYIDPFSTCWSYQTFMEQTRDQGKYITLQMMKDWFENEPADQHLFFGGMWPFYDNFPKKIIKSNEDREAYYKAMDDYWQAELKSGLYSEKDEARMKVRHQVYLKFANKAKNRKKTLDSILEEVRTTRPEWVISKENTHTLFKGDEAFYQREAKYIPMEDGTYSKHGIIAPNGDFYACTFAAHAGASLKICYQQFNDEFQKAKETYSTWHSLDEQDKAKDFLYDKGYVFVQTSGTILFHSKYGDDPDNFPKKQMDTAYGYIYWRREND